VVTPCYHLACTGSMEIFLDWVKNIVPRRVPAYPLRHASFTADKVSDR
jgi:hypothetical protein